MGHVRHPVGLVGAWLAFAFGSALFAGLSAILVDVNLAAPLDKSSIILTVGFAISTKECLASAERIRIAPLFRGTYRIPRHGCGRSRRCRFIRFLADQSLPDYPSSSSTRARIRSRIRSRIPRTTSIGCPAGSSNSQSS